MRARMMLTVLMVAALMTPRAKAAAGAPAPATRSDLVAKIHWVGTAQIATDPNAAKWNQIAALPETAALREETLFRLATAPYQLLKTRIGENTNDFSALIRPLAADLLQSEWYAEMRAPANGVPELLLAVRLDAQRAAVWQTNLATVLTSWTHLPVKSIQAEGFSGWELQKHDDPNLIRFFRAGDWAVFGWGQNDLPLQPGMLQRIKAQKRPIDVAKDYWLDAWVDWPRLAPGQALVGSVKLPRMRLIVQGRKDFVRPQLTMQFPEPLGLKLEPWRIPTGLIHNPIVSFTAVRGVAGYLNELDAVKKMGAGGMPNQFYFWAIEQIPYETCVAAPVNDGSNYLARLQPGLIAWLKTKMSTNRVNLAPVWTTNHMVAITGIPFVMPHLRAVRDPAGDYLMAGLLPSPQRTKPLPPELIKEVTSHPTRVYYDWEITDGRLQQWRSLRQIYYLGRDGGLVSTNTPAQRWLEAIRPKLGNCATEIDLTAQNELSLLRNSPIGFSACELTCLAQWLEAPGFPLSAHIDVPPMVHAQPKRPSPGP